MQNKKDSKALSQDDLNKDINKKELQINDEAPKYTKEQNKERNLFIIKGIGFIFALGSIVLITAIIVQLVN